ncbi:hypothetical protein LNP25_10715 [Klebsiella variicola subsp. variicola]|nr:hypothetical protein [Klebsiella variicola subsp. variicola]
MPDSSLPEKRRVVLPLLPESLYLLGGMVIAAGKTIEKKEVITHNRLYEEAGRLLKTRRYGRVSTL